MPKFTFEKAERVFWHDKVLAKTVLRFIPARVLPNHITVFRFLATPVVAILAFTEQYYVGLFSFLILAFSDVIDGSLARTRDQVTNWGRLYDPIADKILVGSMVFIIVLKYIDWWTAMLIIGLEMVIIVTAWIRVKTGRKVEANRWGKIKMFLQVLGVTILLLAIISDWAELLPFASGTLYLAIAFAIVSLLTYGI